MISNKFLAAATLTLAAFFVSCSHDSSLSSQPDNAISYGVTAGQLSRAADMYGPGNLPQQFSVWAMTRGSSTPYIDGHTIVREGSNWSDQAGTQYWPSSALDFYAVVNDGGCFNFNYGVPKIENFSPNSDASRQTDLLYASAFACSSATPDVPIEFHHALAQIGFKARCTNSDLTVVVKSVTLANVGSRATFTYPTPANAVASWSAATTPTSYKVVLSSPVTLETAATNLTAADGSNIAGALNLIPQSVGAWTPGESSTFNGAYFIVDCTITDKNTGALLRTGGIAMPLEVSWEAGKRYTYIFSFSNHTGGYEPDPSNPDPVMVPIGYSVTVADFVDAEGDDEEIVIGQDDPENEQPELVGPQITANGRTFQFTRGNLQYDTKQKTWSFAENQTDYLSKSGTASDIIDLFCWGATGIGDAQLPTFVGSSASAYPSQNSFYANTMNSTSYDWGATIGDGYFTPTKEDWEEILSTYICVGATMRNLPGNISRPGLLIIPASAVESAKDLVTSKGGEIFDNFTRVTTGKTLDYTGCYLTLEQLEAINGVFFPQAGSSSTSYKGCCYWTANCSGLENGTALLCSNTVAFKLDTAVKRNIALAVRLAKIVN